MQAFCTLALLLVLLATCREPSPTIPTKQLVQAELVAHQPVAYPLASTY